MAAQQTWQDQVDESGYEGSYESVKRFVCTAVPERRLVGGMLSATIPGPEEAKKGTALRAKNERLTP